MGHYMTVMEETNKQAKFPVLDASIIPLVWLKEGIGTAMFCITFTQADATKLQPLTHLRGEPYEKQVTKDVIELLGDQEEVIIQVELSTTGSGKWFLNMFKDILPLTAVFQDSVYAVVHPHKTVPVDSE